jgi:hypothetical protein
MEMEVVGANGVRQVITTTGTFYNGPTHRRSPITMRTDLFEPNTTTPVHSDVQSINHVSKKLDTVHEEMSMTFVSSGRTI